MQNIALEANDMGSSALRKNHQKHFAIWSNINVTVATALLPALMGQEHSNK